MKSVNSIADTVLSDGLVSVGVLSPLLIDTVPWYFHSTSPFENRSL